MGVHVCVCCRHCFHLYLLAVLLYMFCQYSLSIQWFLSGTLQRNSFRSHKCISAGIVSTGILTLDWPRSHCALLTVHPLSFCTLLRKMQKSLKEIHYYWSESVFFSEKALIKEFHPSLTDSLDLLPPRHLVCPEVVHEFSGVDSYLWRVPVLSCSYTNKTGYIIKVCGVCNSCSAWTGKERWYISMADFQLDKIRLPEVSAIGSWRSRISK